MEIRFRLLQRHWRTLGKTGHRSVCLKTEQTARLMCVLEIWSTCRTHRCFFLAVAWPLLCFSPFQYHWQVSSENQRGPGFKSTGSTKLANAGMVSMTHGHAYKTPKASTQEKETSNTAQLRGSTPPGKEVGTPCAEIVRVTLRHANVCKMLHRSSSARGDHQCKNSTSRTSINGSNTVARGTQIPFSTCKLCTTFPHWAQI